MTQTMTDLKAIETQCTRFVCSGGYLTKGQIDRRDSLRQATGMKYDAINGRFELLTEED